MNINYNKIKKEIKICKYKIAPPNHLQQHIVYCGVLVADELKN